MRYFLAPDTERSSAHEREHQRRDEEDAALETGLHEGISSTVFARTKEVSIVQEMIAVQTQYYLRDHETHLYPAPW